jgi:hypothetical protein
MLKCPFCNAPVTPGNGFEFPCPVCRQLVGVVVDGPAPRLVRAAPDNRKVWSAPFLKIH